MVKYFIGFFPTTGLSNLQPSHHTDYTVLATRKPLGMKALAITGHLTHTLPKSTIVNLIIHA
jgi:hypothetical protein